MNMKTFFKQSLRVRPSALALAGAVALVRDTGAGIPPEERDKIWLRLYRGDKSRSQRGLGLGLSLVRAVVEAHQGQVAVRSQLGEGSEFEVTLPKHATATELPLPRAGRRV